jgi:DNA primase
VDTAPIERPVPRDRRTDLLHDFFTLCGLELAAEAGARAREYLEERGLPEEKLEKCGLGVVPAAASAGDYLRACGYSNQEIEQSGVLSDSRWPGRLCGGWRDERGKIRTLWARSLDAFAGEARYLYLRGASRANLLPYGLSWVLKETPRPRELVLVEGLLDVHHLRAVDINNVAALGGTSTQPSTFERLAGLGFESISLSMDRDDAGRTATARAVERAARTRRCPAVTVIDPNGLAPAKDPDEFVRERPDAWNDLLSTRTCGIVWRALEFARGVEPTSAQGERRDALKRAGMWLGSLPARLSLEQEDGVRAVADRCGYTPEAVGRSFRARFWAVTEVERSRDRPRAAHLARGL